jgi:hypothetical protein
VRTYIIIIMSGLKVRGEFSRQMANSEPLCLLVLSERVGKIGRHRDLARCGVERDVHLDVLAGGNTGRGAVVRAQWDKVPAAHRRDGRPVGVTADRDCGALPPASAETMSSGTWIPVAVLPPSSTFVRNLTVVTLHMASLVLGGVDRGSSSGQM